VGLRNLQVLPLDTCQRNQENNLSGVIRGGAEENWFMDTQGLQALRLLGVLSRPSHTGGDVYSFPEFSYLSAHSFI